MAKFSFKISTKLQLQSVDQSLLQKFDWASASKSQSIKIVLVRFGLVPSDLVCQDFLMGLKVQTLESDNDAEKWKTSPKIREDTKKKNLFGIAQITPIHVILNFFSLFCTKKVSFFCVC